MITPKRLWLLVLILLAIYSITYAVLAWNGIHDYSRHFSWEESLLMSIVAMLSMGGIVGGLPALIPFGKKKASERYFGYTFPITTSLFVILIGFLWLNTLYRSTVHGQRNPFNAEELEAQRVEDSIYADSMRKGGINFPDKDVIK